MKISSAVLFAVGLCLWTATGALAEPAGDAKSLQQENAQLKQRVQSLEKDMAALKGMFRQQADELKAVRQVQQQDLKTMKAVLEKDASGKDSGQTWLGIETSLRMKLYGYIKADAAWDSARTSVGDYARWVESEGGRNKDEQFNLTARQTRLGLWIYGPEDENVKTSGRLEIDFYGGNSENKPEPMMRHAYLKIDWIKERFSILAGQTSDVFSPLVPTTLNYAVAWWAGDIGYRRPQIRLTKGMTVCKDVDVEIAGAIARTIGHDNGVFGPGDTGEDYCMPGFQGRVGVTFPLIGEKKTVVGVSGHMAKEEYDLDASDHAKELWSWSANLDITQPILDWLTVKGELFTGSNLDAYLGGIGQGIDVPTLGEVDTCGGWAAASLGPWDQWRFNVGASVEAVNGEDVTTAGARTVNRSIFGNVIYAVNDHASIGFEVSQWHTEYKDQDDGDSLRLQTSFTYKF